MQMSNVTSAVELLCCYMLVFGLVNITFNKAYYLIRSALVEVLELFFLRVL